MKFSEINPDTPVWLYKHIMERSSMTEREERITFGDFFEELKGANDQIEKFIEISKKNTVPVSPGDECFPVQICLYLGIDKIELYISGDKVVYTGTKDGVNYFSDGTNTIKCAVSQYRKLFYVDTLIFKEKNEVGKFTVMTKLTFAGSNIEVKEL